MAASAMALGLVYGADEIAQFLGDQLGPDGWEKMRQWHTEVIVHGLQAPEPAEGFILGVLERARSALRARGRKEAPFIEPLFQRLKRRESPAHRMRAIFAESGMAAVIEEASIPTQVE